MSTHCYELLVDDSNFRFPMVVFGLHDVTRVDRFVHEVTKHAPKVEEHLVEAVIDDAGRLAVLNQLANSEN